MQTGITFTADPNLKTSFGPIDEGDYKVRITECKFEPTPDGLGTVFNFKYTVSEGNFKNRQVFDPAYMSWDESHMKAVDFGHRKFNDILLAIGVPHFAGDTDELIGYEMLVHVKKEPYTKKDGTPGERNNVSSWNPVPKANTVMNSAPVAPSMPNKPTFGNNVPNNPFNIARK